MSSTLASVQKFSNPFDGFSDSRTHGYQGPTRKVRLARVTPSGGGGAISKSEDGVRCAVTGKECELKFCIFLAFH
jgi:hypothetical protein